jgi:hypothetical protein
VIENMVNFIKKMYQSKKYSMKFENNEDRKFHHEQIMWMGLQPESSYILYFYE